MKKAHSVHEMNVLFLKTAVFVLALSFSRNAFATAQMPDALIYEGEKYSMFTNPLEIYFRDHPERRPKSDGWCTALWRGYLATFIIENGSLYVKAVEVMAPGREKWKNVTKKIFPKKKKVKADFFSGLLVLPQGDLIEYVHMGYASIYEKYTLIEIEKGEVKKILKFTGEEYMKFKERQFAAFKKTEEYAKLLLELSKDGGDPEFLEEFIKDYIIEYSNKLLTD